MPIVVQHSPIVAGMKLAEQAGEVDDWRYRQGMAENRRAFDIQTGLQYDKMRQDFLFGAEGVAAQRTANKIQQMQYMADLAERRRQFDIGTQMTGRELDMRQQQTRSDIDYRQQMLDLQNRQAEFEMSPYSPESVRAQAYSSYQQGRGQPEFYGSEQQKMFDAQVRSLEDQYRLAKSRFEDTMTEYGHAKPGMQDLSRRFRREMDQAAAAYQNALAQQSQLYQGGPQVMIGGQVAGAVPQSTTPQGTTIRFSDGTTIQSAPQQQGQMVGPPAPGAPQQQGGTADEEFTEEDIRALAQYLSS